MEEQKGVSQEILQTFWSLAEGGDAERVKAADKLTTLVVDKQGQVKEPCVETQYSLRRLLRGLASSRKWARVGYATALTQLLRQLDCISVKLVMEVADKELQYVTSETKAEKSNAMLGQVMACLSVLHADVKLSGAEAGAMAAKLVDISNKKAPLELISTQALKELIAKTSSAEFSEHVWPHLESVLTDGWEKCSADHLLLLIITHHHHPDIISKSFLEKHWACKKIMSVKNVNHFKAVLMKSTTNHPIIHSLADMLVEHMLKKTEILAAFCSTLKEPLEKGSAAHGYLCCHLVCAALAKSDNVEQIEAVLDNSNVIPALLQITGKKNHLLNVAAKQSLLKICESGKNYQEDKMKLLLVRSLLKEKHQFDSFTRTQTVAGIIHTLTEAGVEEWCGVLKDSIMGTGEFINSDADADETSLVQKDAVSRLVAMAIHPSMTTNMKFHLDNLKFLLCHGFFDVKAPKPKLQITQVPQVRLIPAVRQSIQSGLAKYMDKLSKARTGAKTKSLMNYISTLTDLVKYAQVLLSAGDQVQCINPISEEALAEWDKMMKCTEKIKKKHISGDQLGKGHAFLLLFLQLGLQLLNKPQDAMEALQDLHICSEKALTDKKASKKSSEPAWVEVVTDLLLSLLSQESHLVRMTAVAVFGMLTPNLTQEACELLIQALRSDPNAEDGMLGFEEEDEEEEEAMEVEEDGEQDNSAEDSDESDNSEDEDSSDNEEDETIEIGDDVRARVQAALGDAAAASDEEESDADLDDEAMFRLDDALAAAFRGMNRSKHTKENKVKALQLKHYKLRCLDLVSTIVSSEPPTSTILMLLRPMLEIVDAGYRNKAVKEEGAKASSILSAIFKIKKYVPDSAVDPSTLPEMFKELVAYSCKVSSVPVVKMVAGAAVVVMRVLISSEESTGKAALKNKSAGLEELVTIMRESIQDFCTKRDTHLNHMLFHTILEKEPVMMWPLAEFLLQCSLDSKIRIFCKTQTCSLLSVMVRKDNLKALQEGQWETFLHKVDSMLMKNLSKYIYTSQKQRYVYELLLFLNHCMAATTDMQMWTSDEFVQCVKSVRENFKKLVRPICSRILKKLGISLDPIPIATPKNKAQKRRKPEAESAPEQKKKKKSVPQTPEVNGDESSSDEQEDMDSTNGQDVPSEDEESAGSSNEENTFTQIQSPRDKSPGHQNSSKKKNKKNKPQSNGTNQESTVPSKDGKSKKHKKDKNRNKKVK